MRIEVTWVYFLKGVTKPGKKDMNVQPGPGLPSLHLQLSELEPCCAIWSRSSEDPKDYVEEYIDEMFEAGENPFGPPPEVPSAE